MQKPSKFSVIIYFALCTMLCILGVFRLFLVAPTQDEFNTFFEFILPFHIDLFGPPYSANNHALNTLLSGIVVRLFGPELWSLRMISALSFPVFCWGLWKLATRFKPLLFWSLILALLGNYFLFEFFFFSRGYGLSMAALVIHFHFLWSYVERPSARRTLWAILPLVLALLANLSLLVYSMLVTSYFILDYLIAKKWRSFGSIGVVVLIAAVVMATIAALCLQSKGELYFGRDDGFFEVTVFSLLNMVRLHASPVVLSLLGVSSVLLLTPLLKLFKKPPLGLLREPSVLVSLSLMLVSVAAVLMNVMLKVNYPYERSAIYFFPLFWLALMSSVNEIRKPVWQTVASVFVLLLASYFPIDFSRSAAIGYSHVEPYGNLPRNYYETVMEHADSLGIETPVIQGDPRMARAWILFDYLDQDHRSVFRESAPQPDYVIHTDDFKDGQLLLAESFPGQNLFLSSVEASQESDSRKSLTMDGLMLGDEYSSIADSTFIDSLGVWDVSVAFQMDSLPSTTMLHLVCENGRPEDYQLLPLRYCMNSFEHEDHFHTRFQVLGMGSAQQFKLYFWNPKREAIIIRGLKVIATRRSSD